MCQPTNISDLRECSEMLVLQAQVASRRLRGCRRRDEKPSAKFAFNFDFWGRNPHRVDRLNCVSRCAIRVYRSCHSCGANLGRWAASLSGAAVDIAECRLRNGAAVVSRWSANETAAHVASGREVGAPKPHRGGRGGGRGGGSPRDAGWRSGLDRSQAGDDGTRGKSACAMPVRSVCLSL